MPGFKDLHATDTDQLAPLDEVTPEQVRLVRQAAYRLACSEEWARIALVILGLEADA